MPSRFITGHLTLALWAAIWAVGLAFVVHAAADENRATCGQSLPCPDADQSDRPIARPSI